MIFTIQWSHFQISTKFIMTLTLNFWLNSLWPLRYWPLSWPRRSDPQTSGTLCTPTQKHLFLTIRTQRSLQCVLSEIGYGLSPEYWGESLQQHPASEKKQKHVRVAYVICRKLQSFKEAEWSIAMNLTVYAIFLDIQHINILTYFS